MKQLKAAIAGVNYQIPSNTDTCSYVLTPFPCFIPADPVKAYIFKRSNNHWTLKSAIWLASHGKKHTPAPGMRVNLNILKSTTNLSQCTYLTYPGQDQQCRPHLFITGAADLS